MTTIEGQFIEINSEKKTTLQINEIYKIYYIPVWLNILIKCTHINFIQYTDKYIYQIIYHEIIILK